ncbi:MAG: glycosyltransferase family 4 protein [Thermoplasmatota archaeon]
MAKPVPFDILHLLPAREETRRNLEAACRRRWIPLICGPPFFEMPAGAFRKLRIARAQRPTSMAGLRRVLLVAEEPLYAAQAGLRIRREMRAVGIDARLLVYLGWDAPHENRRYGPLGSRIADGVLRRHLLAADGILSVSQWTSRRYRTWMGPTWDELAVHHQAHGIDARFLETPPRRPVAAHGPRRLVTVTNLNYQEKADALAAMAGSLHDLPGDWTWRIVGDGAHRATLEAATAGLGDRVTFTGALAHEEVIAELDAADLFLYGSHLDAMPRAVQEAQARGLPALVYGDSGATEPVAATGAGAIAVEPDDVAAILHNWRDDPAAFQSVAALAASIESSSHSWDAFIDGLGDAWQRLDDRR